MPDLFGFKAINYWQALCVSRFSAMLIKGVPSSPSGKSEDQLEDLVAKVAAIRAAEAAGAMSRRVAEAHCARLRAEHERAKAGTGPTDPAGIAANAEALRAALLDGAVDARSGRRCAGPSARCAAGRSWTARRATCMRTSKEGTCRCPFGLRSATVPKRQVFLRW